MSALKSKLALLTDQPKQIEQFKAQGPLILSPELLNQNRYHVDLLLVDADYILKQSLHPINAAKVQKQFLKKALVLGAKYKESTQIDLAAFIDWQIDYYVFEDELDDDFIHGIWQAQLQIEQDETYLSLSTELNQQYEILKNELQTKLNEKSKNIIESRKQIYEINNRVEVLRKSLYTTTEVKSLTDAETALNDLLVKFGMITWFKIVRYSERVAFEKDLKEQTDSTIHSTEMKIGGDYFYLFFFKGDKRSFRKSDINYFNKLTEALQINLSRYNNLISLQQSERLFDLAFHSSPQPIIVVDQNYQVYQANLAAEKNAEANGDDLKCHQLLFGSPKPCAGCQFGSRFEIQKDTRTFAVQSSRFSSSGEGDQTYWVHLYEDISEQKALESKYQQAAKLSEVGLITSSIAHELNNPLGGILSYLQIMKMELPATHPFQQDLHGLTEASLRMKKHIEDLLFFSRKEDHLKLENIELNEVFVKTLDLLQMQLKKEHLTVSYQPSGSTEHRVSILHFRNIIHLTFQFLLHKLRLKRQMKANFSGLVEVKISQDQSASYLILNANLGPHDLKQTSNDLSLVTLEKSLLDQGFQLVITEPQAGWMQVLIKMPAKS